MDRVVVGITGASGIPYGVRLLEILREFDVEVHLTCSPSAELVNKHEGDGRTWKEVLALADVVHDNGNLAASIASGSFKAKAMAIVPCSGTTLGKLAAGISDNLATNIFAQAGKCKVPCIVLACDTEPEHDTKAPSKMVKVFPRKIDLQNTEKLKSFELTTVVSSVNDLKKVLKKI